MIKQFTPLQLFSLVDGRLSTNMDDVYEMLNHICDVSLNTHHLPVALKYLRSKYPNWFKECTQKLTSIKNQLNDNSFETLIGYIKNHWNEPIDVPQLKDEIDTSDFGTFMIDNSLLLNK